MKLVEVMALIKRVPKNGHNQFHNYDYVKEEDIVEEVRGALAERNLLLVPDTESHDVTPFGEKGDSLLTTISVRYHVLDGETGEQMSFRSIGQGSDKGDKGAYKASTGSLKYALLKLFMIATGNDPEREDMKANAPPPAPSGVDALKTKVTRPSPPRQAAPAKSQTGFSLNFGKHKGVALPEVPTEGLEWYEIVLLEGVADPSKARFKTQNQMALGYVRDELESRR